MLGLQREKGPESLESITCCLSTWMTVAALPSALFPWWCGEFFWVCRKQVSKQSYIALETWVQGKGLRFYSRSQGNWP